jgi:hypothetical protein
MSGNPIPGDEEKFLLAEYEALINIDTSRNERLGRAFTIAQTGFRAVAPSESQADD